MSELARRFEPSSQPKPLSLALDADVVLPDAVRESLIRSAEAMLAVSADDRAALIETPLVDRNLSRLHAELNALYHDLQVEDKVAAGTDIEPGITSIDVDSVYKEDGDVSSGMVTLGINTVNREGDLRSVQRKVELCLNEDQNHVLSTVRSEGDQRRFIVGEWDPDGTVRLPRFRDNWYGFTPWAGRVYHTTSGGTNRRTELIDENARVMSRYGFEQSVLFSVPGIVRYADDLVTALAAVELAEPEEAEAIAQALIERQSDRAQRQREFARPEVVIGRGLPEDILAFPPFGEILADKPNATGIICDHFTPSRMAKPLLASVVGIVAEDGYAKPIEPVLARQDSVAAGVFVGHADGRQEMVTVSEIRPAVGTMHSAQLIAGGMGDRGEMRFAPAMIEEIREEAGIEVAPDQLRLIGDFRANPNTTEHLFLFYGVTDAKERMENVFGSDSGERTTVFMRRVDVRDTRKEFTVVRDAKTELLVLLEQKGVLDALDRLQG